MDDPNEENIEDNWVIVNPIDVAEEALEVNLQINNAVMLAVATKQSKGIIEKKSINNHPDTESDLESDGISIISESSHLHEITTDDENLQTEVGEHEFIKEDTSNNSPDTKANWMFVDSLARSWDAENRRQFLQEPIHELSENELGSVQSDLESDGISIISECEFFEGTTQIYQDAIATEISEKDKLDHMNNIPNFVKKYFNGFLIGTILLASSSIFLGHYFNSVDTFDDDLPIYNEDFKNEIQEISDNMHEIQEKYHVPTALAYCNKQHKSDDIFMEQNVKKCLHKIENRTKRRKENILKKEQIEKLEKYLEVKEKYLNEKEKFLIKREFEILKAELNIECDRLKISKFYNTADIVDSKDFTNADGKSRLSTEDKFDNSPKILNKKQLSNDDYMKKKYNYKRNKYSKDTKKKSKNLNYLNKCKDKKSSSSKNVNRDKQSCQGDGNEKFKNNKDRTSSNNSLNYILVENKNDSQSGYWVGKLYKGRTELRKKHNSGDWSFDRAFYRKRKRDKAKWYFDWMMERETLRYKRTYHI